MLNSIFISTITLCSVLGRKLEREDSNFQLILLPDCQTMLKNWDFRCQEVYSPYFCSQFMKNNFKVVNILLKIHYRTRVKCIQK